MFIALDSNGNRIDVADAVKGNEYFCPVCDGRLRIREGKINIKHFSHISGSDCDDFSVDMSEWHRKWQEQFPLKNREVVIKHNGEKHRADVLAYGHVIEFQHSPISLDEFERRNDFYVAAGKKVIWVFDLIEEMKTRRVCCEEEWKNGHLNGGKWSWSNSKRIFRDFLPQKSNNVVLLFQFFDTTFDKEQNEFYLERVVWAVDEWDYVSFRKFNTSYFPGTKNELLSWIKNRQAHDLRDIPVLNTAFIKVIVHQTSTSPQSSSKGAKITSTPNLWKTPKPTPPPIFVANDINDIPKEDFFKNKYIEVSGVRYALCTVCNQIFPQTEMTTREWSRGQCRTCCRKKESCPQ